MKIIPLTKGKVAIVSDEDYPWISQWKWCAMEAKRKNRPSAFYAYRSGGRIGPRKLNKYRPPVYMHSEIGKRQFPHCSLFDHKDRDGLNNCRDNLRPCTQGQNLCNKTKTIGQSSKFKGVSFFKRTKSWQVRVGREWIGYFKNEKDGAIAYNTTASKRYGEFALLNDVCAWS